VTQTEWPPANPGRFTPLGTPDDAGNMSTPAIQRLPSLGEEFMPLVDGSDPRDRSRLMVEDLVSHVRRHAHAGHTGNNSPAQIM